MKRILTIITAIICMCSCEKEQAHWLYDRWSGEYDTTMTNNDTGKNEEHAASISLEFSEDRSECVVTKGIHYAHKSDVLFVGGWQPGIRVRCYKNLHIFLGPTLATDCLGLHLGIGF